MADGTSDRFMSETERSKIHSSLYSRHSRTYVEGVSVEVCNILTWLGYGEQIRRTRIQKYRDIDMLWNAINIGMTRFTAGSKSEGLTCFHESDLDLLYVPNNVLSVEAGVDLHTIPDDIEVYRMDTRVYPGHCRMLVERPNSTLARLIDYALCDDGNGNVILSSTLFLDMVTQLIFPGHSLARVGPSLAMSDGLGLNIDRVDGIRCQCPSIIQRWAQRPRHWPPPDVVQKVVSLGSVVTPVGFKGSEDKHLEWRICFNIGETELVNNLSATQTKLYVILKMSVKEVMKPKKIKK